MTTKVPHPCYSQIVIATMHKALREVVVETSATPRIRIKALAALRAYTEDQVAGAAERHLKVGNN